MTTSSSTAAPVSTGFDLIVIGGGIAGVSVGYEMADDRTVCLLEMESTLAFHTTGRSAASYLETYGHAEIQSLTTASRSFFENPPAEFDGPLMTSRPLLQFARVGRGEVVRKLHAGVLAQVPNAKLLTPDEVAEVYPLITRGVVELGMLEPGAMELDVHALHQGFVRGFRKRGGVVVKGVKVIGLDESDGMWTVSTSDGVRRVAKAVVNAAGAWGDEIGLLAGAGAVGLVPLRRSIFMIKSPSPESTRALPTVADVDCSFYIKPEGHQMLCSPADETPMAPGDVKADQLEIARAIDAISSATELRPKSVSTSWAGLRTFTADKNFVIGPDPQLANFHWCVGQGGFGIQTAPAAARVAASLIRARGLPSDVAARGLDLANLSPGRIVQNPSIA